MDGTVLPSIPILALHDGVTKEQIDVDRVCTQWLKTLEMCFNSKSFDNVSPLLIENCWWRDIIGLSWDFTSKHGYDAITTFLANAPNPITKLRLITDGGLKPALLDIGGMIWIHAVFSFRHQHVVVKGLVRLVHVRESEWKARLVSTQLENVYARDSDTYQSSSSLNDEVAGISIDLTRLMCAHDKTTIDGLKKVGMALRTGEDRYGIADYQLIHGGHFYIDRGASQMIVDGRIKIRRCERGISAFHRHGLILADGTKLDADVVVYATGYRGIEVTVERLMGSDVARRVGATGGLDAENERVGGGGQLECRASGI
ncbi:hypothetical protein F5Y09DRAFT_317939 [Xylaria sp. FL1042]|nr:hypothetical protein F5Y09DRAFT_317939 [Xylaria sp. FL1042]